MALSRNGSGSLCLKCRAELSSADRARGRCPCCAAPFQTAELSALCAGIAVTFVLSLALPELVAAVRHGAWSLPSFQVVRVRGLITGIALLALLLPLYFVYDLWQGEALRVRPWLRALWLLALPGLVLAAIVVGVGVPVVALRNRCSLPRAFAEFMREG